MSKYIKLYDAIMAMDEWFSEPITPTKILSDLPTIEVSEDCISKAYLEQEIENQTMTVNEEYWQGWNNALDKVVELIEEAPSVVPTTEQSSMVGKWIADRYCSECEWDKSNADYTSGWTENYCPNCGAYMRGSNNE